LKYGNLFTFVFVGTILFVLKLFRISLGFCIAASVSFLITYFTNPFSSTLKFDAVRLDSQHRSAYSSFDIGIASCLAADMFEGASNAVPLNHSWLTSLEVSHFAL
jgi:hypothetical protein